MIKSAFILLVCGLVLWLVHAFRGYQEGKYSVIIYNETDDYLEDICLAQGASCESLPAIEPRGHLEYDFVVLGEGDLDVVFGSLGERKLLIEDASFRMRGSSQVVVSPEGGIKVQSAGR
ncbi:hypothetical protein [Rubritalea squalenifaciens]|uniref:hypothetical protein n=1 Tax=Rubritalea squalenifaciens TaxID=407226 RepID=UPI00135671C0|nr:hypothetical protein [Rubritalea squalenifaciens]